MKKSSLKYFERELGKFPIKSTNGKNLSVHFLFWNKKDGIEEKSGHIGDFGYIIDSEKDLIETWKKIKIEEFKQGFLTEGICSREVDIFDLRFNIKDPNRLPEKTLLLVYIGEQYSYYRERFEIKGKRKVVFQQDKLNVSAIKKMWNLKESIKYRARLLEAIYFTSWNYREEQFLKFFGFKGFTSLFKK
jgi:hypothetical protein